ncbi:SRPBCC domain-containing protein [Carnobacterium gallinarum]|uniref:hypothetical protein n=1 Tax=Carnobacterium gallinarum TaxID=2749 RepID=UPI0005514115|nr:hypothetical protein [Carnobacterium gallinarum]
MKERIEAQEDATIEASFDLFLDVDQKTAWELLTTTEGLQKWFNELQIGELGATGFLEFIMTPEEKITMPILSYQPQEVIGFQWDQNQVLFHIEGVKPQQTKLTFREIITAVNGHTGRDIAGWKMCLHKLMRVSQNKPYVFNQVEFDQSALRYQKECEFLAET